MISEDIQLVVKRSTLANAGKGLFTKKYIPKGTRILEYTGRITTWKDVNHSDGSNPYIFYVTRNYVIDAEKDLTILGRYANDARGLIKTKGITNNCKFIIDKKRVYIDAIKPIPAGSEIFVAYGKEYWDIIKSNKKIDDVNKTTVTKKKKVGKKL